MLQLPVKCRCPSLMTTSPIAPPIVPCRSSSSCPGQCTSIDWATTGESTTGRQVVVGLEPQAFCGRAFRRRSHGPAARPRLTGPTWPVGRNAQRSAEGFAIWGVAAREREREQIWQSRQLPTGRTGRSGTGRANSAITCLPVPAPASWSTLQCSPLILFGCVSRRLLWLVMRRLLWLVMRDPSHGFVIFSRRRAAVAE